MSILPCSNGYGGAWFCTISLGSVGKAQRDQENPPLTAPDMELLGTDASYKNRGAASMILQYGCDRADEEGVECYVDSSPQALRLYQKFGWVKKAEREMPQVGDFRYTEHFLVRPARDRS